MDEKTLRLLQTDVWHAQRDREHRRATGEKEVTEVSDCHTASFPLLTESQTSNEPLSDLDGDV